MVMYHLFRILILLMSFCNSQLLFPPTIIDLIQINEEIRIKWSTVNQRNVRFTKYVISYSTSNWASSNEWPAQMKLSNNCNEFNRISENNSIQNLNCLNMCLNKKDCYNVYSSNSNCMLLGNIQIPQQKPISLDCYTLLEYSNEVTIKYLPINEAYQFKVKLYDNESNSWTPFSSSSRLLDTKIHLVAGVEKLKEDKLKLKWKTLNNLKYLPIAGYKISISIDDSPFEEIEDSYTFLSKFNKLVSSQSTTSSLLDNFHHIRNSNRDHCKNECKISHTCTVYIWSDIHRTCLLQMKLDPFQSKFSQEDHIKNYIINKATEYEFNISKLGHFVFKIEFMTIYGTTGVTFASINLKIEQSPLVKTFIMTAIVFIHLVFLGVISTILILLIKRNFRSINRENSSRVLQLQNSEPDENSSTTIAATVDLPPDYYTIINFNK